jgi:Spy/CpxP family protein refolding chaperone
VIDKRLLIAAAMLIAATFAEAQQLPPGKWWRRDEVVRQLELTRTQQDKLDEVFRGAANDLIDARATVDKLQVALRGELDRAQLRRQELQRLAAQLSSARGKLFEREIMMLADMRGVLNEEQWTRLRSHLDRMRPDRGPGGPGERPMQRQRPRK